MAFKYFELMGAGGLEYMNVTKFSSHNNACSSNNMTNKSNQITVTATVSENEHFEARVSLPNPHI
jgi:hypothetical protein